MPAARSTDDMLDLLTTLRDRLIYFVRDTRPAVYYIADSEIGGILVNAPAFDESLLAGLRARAPLRYIFLPSRRGACDLERWRQASGGESMAFETEVPDIPGTVDLPIYAGRKLSRTIDFLPMSGVTRGSCALRVRNNGGAVFFGPILEPGEDGWPTLMLHDDDHSREERLFGALGLQDVAFEYAYTDVYRPESTRIGPDAGAAINERLRRVIDR